MRADVPSNQPSNHDLIVGLSVINRKWLFATGIQVPLTKQEQLRLAPVGRQ